MGVDYRARKISLGRTVALKMSRSDVLAPTGEAERLRREAENMAALDHPNVVPVCEVGSHGGRSYLSMKFLTGGSLDQHIERHVGDPRAAVRLMGAWGVLTVLNVVVNWLVPFLILLPRPAKRSEGVLVKVCVLLLIGRWLDLYQMVVPVHEPAGPVPTLWDASAMAFGVALLALALIRIFGRVRPIPRGDPYLEESLHHHA